ncbi:DoxX family protein [Larkinella humicola]|uniref:DoxX family protein n=1 Tax=Larkinella humicola TaxID=2607654 RepID=A0A5N1JPM5_9BACT|nr:DoxX family protein [Larkinella humicola]KAA9357576.1 DoxX family protein [Larkinella humicola]
MSQFIPHPLPWNPAQKLVFRFFFAYFLLYVFPFPLSNVPGSYFLTSSYNDVWHTLVPWVGRTILHLPNEITVFPNGSGDTTFNYVQLFCLVVLAFAATLVWSVLDRNRPNYHTLLYGLLVLLRYYLAITMFTYGFAKVFKTQFPFPGITRLMEPYGYSSPMGLAWTFMGYSTVYNWFTGLGEVIGGALLLFRKTTALGAIILVAVIGNIVAINFCFDVPVKLYSSNLLLMALFILTTDGRRLMNVLWLNRPAPALDLTPFRTSRRWRIGRIIFKTLAISFVLYGQTYGGFITAKQYGDHAPKHPLYGLYQVETFARNGDTLAPMLTDTTRWRQVMVGGYKSYPTLTIRYMNDSLRNYAFEPDTAKLQAILYARSDTAHKYRLTYQQPDTNSLILAGSNQIDSIYIRLKKQDIRQFLLVNRGFHWINEYPMNR